MRVFSQPQEFWGSAWQVLFMPSERGSLEVPRFCTDLTFAVVRPAPEQALCIIHSLQPLVRAKECQDLVLYLVLLGHPFSDCHSHHWDQTL